LLFENVRFYYSVNRIGSAILRYSHITFPIHIFSQILKIFWIWNCLFPFRKSLFHVFLENSVHHSDSLVSICVHYPLNLSLLSFRNEELLLLLTDLIDKKELLACIMMCLESFSYSNSTLSTSICHPWLPDSHLLGLLQVSTIFIDSQEDFVHIQFIVFAQIIEQFLQLDDNCSIVKHTSWIYVMF